MKMAIVAIVVLLAAVWISPTGLYADCTAVPSVGVSPSLDADGVMTLTVSYSFPDTTHAGQRSVGLTATHVESARGFLFNGDTPSSMSGTWIVKHFLSCEASGTYVYEATAISCGRHDLKATATAAHGFQADPTVSLAYVGPDDQGLGKVRVNYQFPYTSASQQRSLQYVLLFPGGGGHGVPEYRPPDREGVWEFDFPMHCRANGTYVHEVSARRCTTPSVKDHDTTILDTKPTVSLSAAKPDAQGKIALNVMYGFPQTNHESHRAVTVYRLFADGSTGWIADFQPKEQYGTWERLIDAPCEKGPLTYVAEVRSCNGEKEKSQQTLNLASDPKVTVTVKKGLLNKSTGFKKRIVTVDYDMGDGKQQWKVRLDIAKLEAADGRVFPRRMLEEIVPTAQVGKIVYDYDPDPALGSQKIVFEATASTCTGRATDDVTEECDCEGATLDPVHLTDGNVRVTDADPLPAIAGAQLVRTYNSDEQVVALFGRGWTTLFERRLVTDTDGVEQIVTIYLPANEVVVFRGSGNAFRQTWPKSDRAVGTLSYAAASGLYAHRPAGSGEIASFRGVDGRLVAVRDAATGREARVTYDAAGLPQALTDSWSGMAWNLTIDVPRRLVTSVGVSGRPDLVWSYSYDAAGNLVQVTAPGNAMWRTYEYAANRMTASRDALGNLIESHTYDADAYGISSTGPQDEISAIAYDLPGTTPDERVTRVTYRTGATADYALRASGGAFRPVRITGGCGTCGQHDVTYARDGRGRVVREQDARGYVTLNVYDPSTHNLVRRSTFLQPFGCDPETEASRCRLTPEALAEAGLVRSYSTIETHFEYGDPRWPDRPTDVRTESIVQVLSRRGGDPDETSLTDDDRLWRRETFTYDAVTGTVLETTLSGWTAGNYETRTRSTLLYDGTEGATFAPGGAFRSEWLSLPQPAGLRKQSDGPRTDVADVSAFVYYPVHESVPAELRGHLAAARNAAGHVTHYEAYDPFGNLTRSRDPNGVVSESTFDSLGRLTTTTLKGVAGCDTQLDALCATDLTTTRSYEGAGPLKSETRPGGGVTVYTYDARGRVETISRGPAAADPRERIAYSYDPATGKKSLERTLGWVEGEWVEKSRQSFTYDSDGLLHRVTHADGTFVEYTYDAAHALATVRDENTTADPTASIPSTRYTYTPAGQLRRVTQRLATAPEGVVETTYGYDARGNLTGVVDPNGNVTSYLYDDFDQLVQTISPVTGSTMHVYDAAGQLTSTTDANGVTTTRTYDSLGRISSAVSQTAGATEEVRWTYDAVPFGIGRVTAMTDSTGSTRYSYERRGLLASEAKTIEGTTYTIGYGYDADGNRARIAYPSGRVVTWGHDFAGRPNSASSDGAPIVSSARYLPFGPLTDLVLANGTTKSMSYDARYRPLTNTLAGAEGRSIASYRYEHDPVGNITAIHNQLDSSFSRTFAYDDLHRLTSANTSEALWGNGTYRYDAMGNMRAATLGSQIERTFAYDGTTPKLSSVTTNGRLSDVQYDAAGNEVLVGTAAYEYDARNQLRRAGAGTFAYDGRGLRTITVRPAGIRALEVPSTIGGGSSAEGRVVLTGSAPAGGALVVLTSSSTVASVPDSVTVPAGSSSATFTITTQSVDGEQRAVLTATYNGTSRSEAVTVVGSRTDVAMSPESVVGGESASGTVTIASARERDTPVALESSSSAVRVPEQVLVRAGETSAEFPVATVPVTATTRARISASFDDTVAEAAITVLPPSIVSLAFTPSFLYGGSSTTGAVALGGMAPEAGYEVALSTPAGLLSLPRSVTIPRGARAASFGVAVTPVEVETAVPVTASWGESSISANVTIRPPELSALTVTPSAVVGGELMSAEVVLNAPAAPEGARVLVMSSDPALVPAPGHLFVAAGATTETVSIATAGVEAATPVVLSASRAGITRSATVTLEPPPVTVAALALDRPSLIGTNSALVTVTLTKEAPAGGLEVELTSSDASIATVPPSLTVAAGASQATFEIATSLVSAPVDVVISAAYATVQKNVTLSILPPAGNYVSTLTIAPAFLVGGSAATATVTLAHPSSDSGGTHVLLTSSLPSVAAVPAEVKVHQNAATATFTVTTTPVTAPVAATITATLGGVVQRARIIVAPENSTTLGSFTIDPPRVAAGGSVVGRVTLSAPAPFGGATVTLEPRRRNIVSMPATVTVPEGATSATFSIAADRVHGNKERSLEIVAGYNGVSATSTLTVTPPPGTASTSTATPRPLALCASHALQPCLLPANALATVASNATEQSERFYTLYTPELTLLAETASTMAEAPPIAYEYIWFGSEPLAQVTVATGETHYYFTDHLGTPLLQTNAGARIVWQAEYEPFGEVHSIRTGDGKHQPLRFPGQQASEEAPDLTYNVYRWYRAGWGRYTQSDPLGKSGDAHPYLYATGAPLTHIDPLGEKARTCCTPVTKGPQPFNHCFIHVEDDATGETRTYALHRVKAGLGCTFEGDGFDKGAVNDPRTQCGPWTQGCEADRCVDIEHAFYPEPVDYFYLGPNSNTYAAHLTNKCNLKPPPIAGTWQAPGWGQVVPPENPKKKCPASR